MHSKSIAIAMMAVIASLSEMVSAKPSTQATAPAALPADRPAAPPSSATQPAKDGASMISEAKLPRGYPAPGPMRQVIIKQYPASRAAIVKAADLQDGSDNGMFWPLFQHIKKNHIEMSSPVDMTWSPSQPDGTKAKPRAMAFLYGDPTLGQAGKDGVVQVVDLPALTVLSISIRGDYNAKHFEDGVGQLNKWIAEHAHDYKVAGPPRYLAYNSPFVPGFMRLGEVQLPVTPIK